MSRALHALVPALVPALVLALPLACNKQSQPTEAKAEQAGKAETPPKRREGAQVAPRQPVHAVPQRHPAPPLGPPRDITPSGEQQPDTVGELALEIPKEWEEQQVSGPMRAAQYVLPGPGGDVELAVFRFQGDGGGVDANVERWKQQFQPPEGKTLDDVTKTKKIEAGGLAITLVDISGRYVAAVQPGAAEKLDQPDSRMLGAIVEGSGNPFFFKAVGPAKTVDVWAEPFEKAVSSLKKSS